MKEIDVRKQEGKLQERLTMEIEIVLSDKSAGDGNGKTVGENKGGGLVFILSL